MTQNEANQAERFSRLIDLACTGELQSSVDNLGPIKVNPYYFQEPRLTKMVGFFINSVVPVMKKDSPDTNGISIWETYDISGLENIVHIDHKVMENAARMAVHSGYIVSKENDDQINILRTRFLPTRALTLIDSSDLYITKRSDPKTSSIMGGIAIGLGAGIITTSLTGDLSAAGVIGSSSGYTGGIAAKLNGNIAVGREAYNFYN